MTNPQSSLHAGALRCRNLCQRLSDILDTLVTIPVTLLLIALVGLVGYSVVARYGFSKPPVWTEEISLFMIIFTVFICLRVTFKRGQQIGVTLFTDKLPRLNFVFTMISYFATMLFLAIVTRQSYAGATLFAAYKAPSTGISFYWLYITMAAGCGLACLEILLLTIQRCCTAIINRNEAAEAVQGEVS